MVTQPGITAPAAQQLRADLVSTLRQVSTQTGVDFDYLLQKAAVESSFDPQAQASSSSARGLFQFIDSTWLETIDRHGAEHGLHAAAAAITRDAEGKAVVADAATRREILALRDNPRISALMAAELASDNRETLEHRLGREVGNTELYMAHFLGAGGAAKFLATLDDNPRSQAAEVNPTAARANQAVFYEDGKALTVGQVFARFAGKFDESPGQAPALIEAQTATAFASAAGEPQTATLFAGAAIAAARQPDIAAPAVPARTYNTPAPRTDIPGEGLSLFALSILQALAIPGETDDSPRNEWLA